MASVEIEVQEVFEELLLKDNLNERHLVVIGVSTSEILGKKIGTSGNDKIAQEIFAAVERIRNIYGVHIAYQCCEHLNRALVVREETKEKFSLEEVTVIPVPGAGGAMAACAYQKWDNSIIVEEVKADAGIDIGNTLIGMHIKPVAIPIRPKCKYIGQALVVMAKSRPKLIGGARASYMKVGNERLGVINEDI